MRRYLRDLDGCDADDVYEIVLREMEIPLFVEVLNHCEGNQSRAAAMLGIHRATLRKKLKEYGITACAPGGVVSSHARLLLRRATRERQSSMARRYRSGSMPFQ